MSDPLDAVKREQERTTETLVDAKRQLSEAMDAKAGPPAESIDDAQAQLRSIREELERDLASLRSRIPDTDQVVARVRPVAIAVGGGLAAIALVSRRVSKRRRQRHHEQELREHATALAASFARLNLEAIAADAAAERAAAERGGKGKLVAVALVATGVAAAVWAQTRTRQEPDVWSPAPGPVSSGQPAAPDDVTTEVPTIPIEGR